MLEMHVDSLDSLDDSLKSFYEESDKGGFVLKVNGYKDPDPQGLKSALERKTEEFKKAKDEALKIKSIFNDFKKQYDGIDPEKVKAIISKAASEEEADLMKQGDWEGIVTRRLDKQRAELERKAKESDSRAESEAKKSARYKDLVLENHIRSAATKAGLHSHAVEDAIFRARTMFSLNENGEAVQLDGDGQVVFGKDGKSPFNPIEWLEEMKEKAPHWYPANNTGGGASGNGGKKSDHKDLSKLSPRERLLAARQN